MHPLQVKPGGPISALGRLLNGLLGRSKGTQDHATEVEEGNAGLDAGGELTVCPCTDMALPPPCTAPHLIVAYWYAAYA